MQIGRLSGMELSRLMSGTVPQGIIVPSLQPMASSEKAANVPPTGLAVPISALVLRDKPAAAGDRPDAKKEEEGVYTVENSRVKFQAVEKGISGGMSIEITAGLKENQNIVTGPYASLRELKDGILIKTEPKKDAKTS